jgi:hypothetical protein
MTVQSAKSLGSLNDLRVAGSYNVNPRLSLGLGAHLFIGRNNVTYSQTYEDTIRFTPIGQTNTVTFQGVGISGGAVYALTRDLFMAVSARAGGDITVHSTADTVIARASAPTRVGVGLRYELGASGAVGVRASHEGWSSLKSLGSSRLTAFDSWDLGVGGEWRAGQIMRTPVVLRGGARYRTLPFGYNGSEVEELAVATGIGLQFGLASFDTGLQFANRSVGANGITERAFTLSIGVRVRP